MATLKTVCAVMALFTSLIFVSGKGDTVRVQNETEKVVLEEHLTRMGERLGCYFTMEMSRVTPSATSARSGSDQSLTDNFSPFETGKVAEDEKIKSVKLLIVKLEKDFPGIKVYQNTKNPKIIHVLDSSAKQLPNYALDKEVSLSFSGYLQELPDAIGNVTNSFVQGRRSFSFAEPFGGDHVTKVSFKVSRKKVRDILTDFVPPKGYNRVIWKALTRERDGKRVTEVLYYAPGLDQYSEKEAVTNP